MRLFFLAFDGLDPILVSKWKLKHLLQKKWTSYQSSDEKLTPFLWASIITGLPPEEALPTVHSVLPKNPIFKWVKEHIPWLRGRGLGRLVKRRWVDRRDLARPSIFDQFNSIVIDFPAYNWFMDFEICTKYPFTEVIGDEIRSEILFSTILRHDKYKIQKTISILNQKDWAPAWDIFAVWIHQTDVVNHLFWNNRKRMLGTYLRANSYAKKIKSLLPDGTVMIIASDHGSLNGLHRKEGFVSSSMNLDFDLPKTLTDFYPFLLNILRS
ncbi:TPA: hypothetical protein EYP70_05310 [Candidatus Bathyarchaeota archaeon]|nr:hypothetical protein [Candidatus Bathyarchaeota archaeon]